MIPEIFFNVPSTAHRIGGCVIVDASTHGVVDSRHRVFNYRNMADEKGVKVVLRGVKVSVYRVLKLVKMTSRFDFVS